MRMEVDAHSFLEHILLNVGACLAIIKPTRIASIEERVAVQESFSACIASHGTTIFLVWVSFMSLQRMTFIANSSWLNLLDFCLGLFGLSRMDVRKQRILTF